MQPAPSQGSGEPITLLPLSKATVCVSGLEVLTWWATQRAADPLPITGISAWKGRQSISRSGYKLPFLCQPLRSSHCRDGGWAVLPGGEQELWMEERQYDFSPPGVYRNRICLFFFFFLHLDIAEPPVLLVVTVLHWTATNCLFKLHSQGIAASLLFPHKVSSVPHWCSFTSPHECAQVGSGLGWWLLPQWGRNWGWWGRRWEMRAGEEAGTYLLAGSIFWAFLLKTQRFPSEGELKIRV